MIEANSGQIVPCFAIKNFKVLFPTLEGGHTNDGKSGIQFRLHQPGNLGQYCMKGI